MTKNAADMTKTEREVVHILLNELDRVLSPVSSVADVSPSLGV